MSMSVCGGRGESELEIGECDTKSCDHESFTLSLISTSAP